MEPFRFKQPKKSKNVLKKNFPMHNFSLAEAVQKVQPGVSKETIERENERENKGNESVSYNPEQNTNVVQLQLQNKSKAAIENVVDSFVISDLLTHKIDYEKKKVFVLDAKIKLLKEHSDTMKNSILVQDSKVKQLQREVSNIKDVMDVFKRHANKDNLERKNITKEVNTLINACETLRNDTSSELLKEGQIKSKGEKIISLKKQKTNLSRRNSKTIQMMNAKLLALESELEQCNASTRTNIDTLEKFKAENNKLEAAIEKDTATHECLLDDLKTVTKDCDHYKAEKMKREIMMNDELEQATNELKMKEEGLSALTKTELELKQKLEELKNRNKDACNEVDDLKVKHADFQAIFEAEESKNQIIQKDLEAISANHSSRLEILKQEIMSTREEHNSLKLERRSLENENETITKSLEHLTKEIAHKKIQCQFIQGNENDLTNTFNTHAKEKTALAETLKTLETNVQAFNEKYSTTLENYERNKTDCENVMKQLNDQLTGTIEELASRRDSWSNQISELEGVRSLEVHLKQNESEEALGKLQTIQDELKLGLQKLADDRKRLQDRITEKNAIRESVYKKLTKLQQHADRMKSQRESGPSHRPGILKSHGNFAVPQAPPKNVTFKPTVSWNSASVTSVDSLLDELTRDSHTSRELNRGSGSAETSANVSQCSNDTIFDSLMRDPLYKDFPREMSEEYGGPYGTSPPVKEGKE